jgi:hypothetical protein
MHDFSAANWSNVRLVECEQRNCPAFSGHKLDLEGRAITIAVHQRPYVALFQAIFVNVMRKDDRIQFTNHVLLAGLPVALIGPWRRCWGVGTYRLYGLANYIMRGEKVQSNLPQLLVRNASQLWGLLSLRREWARQVDEGREQTAGALLLQPPQQKQKPLALPRTFSTVASPFHPPRAGWSFGSSSSYKEFRALSTFRATATDD